MADEQQELRRVSWTEIFSFTHIFKSFRMAIHPSKLLLALVAVLLVYLAGRTMDGVWGLWDGRARNADPGVFYQAPSCAHFEQYQDAWETERVRQVANLYTQGRSKPFAAQFAPVLGRYEGSGKGTRPAADSTSLAAQFLATAEKKNYAAGEVPSDLMAKVEKDWDEYWDDYVDDADKMLDRAEEVLEDAHESTQDQIKKITDKSDRKKAEETLDKDLAAFKRAIWQARVDVIDKPCREVVGRGLFAVLLDYEQSQFGQAIRAVADRRFFTGFDRVLDMRGRIPGTSIDQVQPVEPAEIGFFAHLYLMAWGVIWLAFTHPIYALIFLVIGMAVWAIFGGAIARVAALHAAREEKISISQAIKFSMSKFLSFFTAPLIPLVIIGVIGLVLGLGGLLMAVSILDIVMAVLFVLALVFGALIAFLTLGWAAGMPLMYPTIAVEGSDSFDAISRSYSYVFARPWRYGLYTLVAVAYGTICYLFVRLFAWLLLLATHFFVADGFFGLGLGSNKAPELVEGATKMDLLWTTPTFWDLGGSVNWAALGGAGAIASLILHIWVYMVVALVVAFVLSFCVSTHTVIYYLLRRKVDATDLDDVYVEEPEAELPAEAQSAAPAEKPAEGQTPEKPEGEK